MTLGCVEARTNSPQRAGAPIAVIALLALLLLLLLMPLLRSFANRGSYVVDEHGELRPR